MQNQGGIGYLASRTAYSTRTNLLTADGVLKMAATMPMELLSLLEEVSPEIGLALYQGDALGCTQEAFRIEVKTVKNAKGESESAPEGQAAVDALFSSLPQEVGDLNDCLSQNWRMLQVSAMCAVECVPGPRGTGLKEVWPINTTTLRFDRDDKGQIVLVQKQAGAGFVPLPMERTFWSKFGGLPDNPGGSPPLAPALAAYLMLLSLLRDLGMAVHRIGYPKYHVTSDGDMDAQFAMEKLDMVDKDDILDYVEEQLDKLAERFEALDIDEAFITDVKQAVAAIGAGDKFPDFSAIYNIFSQRLEQALKTSATIMGRMTGSTETWSVVQWDAYARGLKKGVSKAANPIVDSANLHLQLLGMPYIAVPHYEELRSITRLQDAQAEEIEIKNEIVKRDENLQDQNTTGMKLTGSKPVGPAPEKQDPAGNPGEKKTGAGADRTGGDNARERR